MSERSKYLTVIVSEPTQEEAAALIGHPKMSAASWSHAINDRDAKDAEIAELRKQRNEASVLQLRAMRERDEARECVGRLWRALDNLVEWTHSADCKGDPLSEVWPSEFKAARDALAATPEHLLP